MKKYGHIVFPKKNVRDHKTPGNEHKTNFKKINDHIFQVTTKKI